MSLGQKVVRAAGGALNFNSNGLNDNDINDDNRNDNVAVAAALPGTSVSSFIGCLKSFV